MTSFMAILGKLADLYGRKRIYLVSMALFIGGSIISGTAHSMEVLLIGRGIQFKNRNFVVISALVFVFILSIMGSLSSFPFFTQNVLGLTPTESGYLNLPIMVGAIGASVIAGRLMNKLPYRTIICYIISIDRNDNWFQSIRFTPCIQNNIWDEIVS